MLSVKTKLSTIEILISKVLIDSYVNHGKFVSVTNMLREHNEMKEKKKILKMPGYCKTVRKDYN